MGGAVEVSVSAMPLWLIRRNTRKRLRCTANPDAVFLSVEPYIAARGVRGQHGGGIPVNHVSRRRCPAKECPLGEVLMVDDSAMPQRPARHTERVRCAANTDAVFPEA